MPQSTIDKAILSTQIQEGFKIKLTDNLNDTIKWISQMHFTIKDIFNDTLESAKISYQKEINLNYTFEEFSKNSSKS